MKLRNVGLTLITAMLISCGGKVVVIPVSNADPVPPMEGIYYALPKTVVKVDQPVERISAQPGKYVVYLPLFFPRIVESGAFVSEAKVTFKVKKATISTYGEPDPQRIFYLRITDNGPIDRMGLFEYTEQGTVSGVSGQADNVTSDIVLGVVQTAVGLAGKGIGAGANVPEIKERDCRNKCIPKKIQTFQVRPGMAFDAEYLIATFCRLSEDTQSTLDKAAGDCDKSASFDDALRAYAEIYNMQIKRTEVRETPQSFSVDAALKDFDAAIAAALAENFVGMEKNDTWIYSTELRDFKLDTPVELMRVHESEGLCFPVVLPAADRPPKSFWFGSASYLCDPQIIKTSLERKRADVKDRESEAYKRLDLKVSELPGILNKAESLTASFALNPATGQQCQLLKSARQDGERGFFYQIPATVDVVLRLGEDPITKSRQSIAQFGTLASLPASTGGKSTAYALKFYEATGALKSFNVASKAVFQKDTAAALGTDMTTLAEARRSAAEAKRAQTDELTILDRQSKIMAAKKAIYDNCKALNMPCGGFVPVQPAPEQ